MKSKGRTRFNLLVWRLVFRFRVELPQGQCPLHRAAREGTATSSTLLATSMISSCLLMLSLHKVGCIHTLLAAAAQVDPRCGSWLLVKGVTCQCPIPQKELIKHLTWHHPFQTFWFCYQSPCLAGILASKHQFTSPASLDEWHCHFLKTQLSEFTA